LQRLLVGFEVNYVVAQVIHGQFLLGHFINILLYDVLEFGLVFFEGLFVVAVFVVEVAQLDSVALQFVLVSAEDVLLLFGDVPIVKQHIALVAHALWFWFCNADLAFLA